MKFVFIIQVDGDTQKHCRSKSLF